LRFDPIDADGTVSFADAKIVDRKGKLVRSFTPDQFVPAHQIASLIPKNGGLEMRTTPGDNDPYLIMSMGDPFTLPVKFGFLHRFLCSLPVFLIVFFGVLFASAFDWGKIISGQTDITGATTPSTGRMLPLKTGKSDPWLTGVMVALVLFKLWLVSAQTIYAMGGAEHDDQLFIDLANNLLGGRWLGHYNEYTLMKGPMYSIFIAGAFLLNVPLFTALQLVYASGCGLVVRAIRPLALHRWLRLALFTVLLFNPMTFESMVNARILRQNFIPGLVLLVVAGFVGLYIRHAWPKRQLLPWALLAGTILPVFWMTREDSVWILPCVGLLWATTIAAVWRKRAADRTARLALLALPALLWMSGMGVVAGLNLKYYGIFTTCEMRQADFKAAYGALLRVEPAKWRPYISVPREMRERLYAVSPAFAELRPFLEGGLGLLWAQNSEALTNLPPKEHEIADGWFIWELRDAVSDAGHCHTGAEAMAYYARLAREINEACDRGLVKAGPRRTGFVPPLRREYLQPFKEAMQSSVKYLYSFDEMYTESQPSIGLPWQLLKFADLTRGRLGPLPDGPPLPPRQLWLDRVRVGILGKISHTYQVAAPWAGGTALLALLAAGSVAIIRRKLPCFAIVTASLLGSMLAMVALISLIQVTSFPSLNTGYFSGCYGLYLLFAFTSWLTLIETLQNNPSSDLKTA
jgi:hypothetical protein